MDQLPLEDVPFNSDTDIFPNIDSPDQSVHTPSESNQPSGGTDYFPALNIHGIVSSHNEYEEKL